MALPLTDYIAEHREYFLRPYKYTYISIDHYSVNRQKLTDVYDMMELIRNISVPIKLCLSNRK